MMAILMDMGKKNPMTNPESNPEIPASLPNQNPHPILLNAAIEKRHFSEITLFNLKDILNYFQRESYMQNQDREGIHLR